MNTLIYIIAYFYMICSLCIIDNCWLEYKKTHGFSTLVTLCASCVLFVVCGAN